LKKLSRQQLFHLSRDRRFLLRAALLIAGVSLVFGLGVSLLTTRAGVSPISTRELDESVLEELDRYADPGNMTTPQLAGWVRNPRWVFHFITSELLEEFDGIDKDLDFEVFSSRLEEAVLPFIESGIAESERLDSSDRKLLMDLFNGLHGEETEASDALESLRSDASTEPPRRYASEFLGDVLVHVRDVEGALESYRLENERFNDTAKHARLQIVRLLKQEDRTDELRELFADPQFREILPYHERVRIAAELGQWGPMFYTILTNDLRIGNPAFFLLSMIAGMIWLVIVTQFSGYGRTRMTLYLVALVLGWFSATATLFVVHIQDLRGFEHHTDDPLVQQLVYCIAGIGLREETLKLLFFIPLVPFLWRRGRETEVLVCAGLVGLGFAMNENANYLERFGAFTAWTRFLTANFLHIAMTGVIGLSFFRTCRRPKRQWDNFLYDFLIIVTIHGVYDALGMVPALVDYSILWIVVYALTAYLFLDQAAKLMEGGAAHTVSPLAVFVLGAAMLMGVILVYASWGTPFRVAITEYIRSLADMLPIAFVFINRLRDY